MTATSRGANGCGAIMSPGDAEFYESKVVLELAYVIAGARDRDFSNLHYLKRKHALDIASRQAADLGGASSYRCRRHP